MKPGDVIVGKYRVLDVLGRGGMGVVVAAWHLQLEQRVALKVLTKATSPEHVERFRREAKAAARIKSEHIARVLDLGELEDKTPFFVMELLEGEDLAQLLERRGPLQANEIARFLIEACDALAEAHALGIVHRDLKPANLFLARRPDGSTMIKLLDFGISKIPSPQDLTNAHSFVGSPRYMSPEQLTSPRTVDARADIWALGVILYELLSGRTPFNGDTIPEIVGQVIAADAALLPNLPPGLGEILGRCLVKKREGRFASVAELAKALAPFAPGDGERISVRISRLLADRPLPDPAPIQPIRQSQPSFAAPTRPRQKRSGLPIWLTALTAVATLLAGAIVIALSRRPPPTPAFGLSAGSIQPIPVASLPTSAPVPAPVPAPAPNPPTPTPTPTPTRTPPPHQAARPTPSSDPCNPPYYFDELQVKRYKAECLAN